MSAKRPNTKGRIASRSKAPFSGSATPPLRTGNREMIDPEQREALGQTVRRRHGMIETRGDLEDQHGATRHLVGTRRLPQIGLRLLAQAGPAASRALRRALRLGIVRDELRLLLAQLHIALHGLVGWQEVGLDDGGVAAADLRGEIAANVRRNLRDLARARTEPETLQRKFGRWSLHRSLPCRVRQRSSLAAFTAPPWPCLFK